MTRLAAAQIAQIALIPKRIENTASETSVTDTSQIAEIAQMLGARHPAFAEAKPLRLRAGRSSGAILSCPDADARLESRAPSDDDGGHPNRPNRPIPQRIEDTASEAPVTDTLQIAQIAQMPGARHRGGENSAFSGAIFSCVDDDARLESRAPSDDAAPAAPLAPIAPDWRHLVRTFCRLGATDERLAELFSVSPETIAGWMADIPDFARAVRGGRSMIDVDVIDSLHQLGLGYSHTAEKVLMGRNGPMVVSYSKYHRPNVRAGIAWLENRFPDEWGRAAIKRKLQEADAARDDDARRPPLLSPQALAALVLAREEASGIVPQPEPSRAEPVPSVVEGREAVEARPSATDVQHNFVERWNDASERHAPDRNWACDGSDVLSFPTTPSAPRGTNPVRIQRMLGQDTASPDDVEALRPFQRTSRLGELQTCA